MTSSSINIFVEVSSARKLLPNTDPSKFVVAAAPAAAPEGGGGEEEKKEEAAKEDSEEESDEDMGMGECAAGWV